MRLLRLVPDQTNIDFLRYRMVAFAISGLMILASIATLATNGLNLGIDFAGGILMEVRAEEPIDVAETRQLLNGLDIGEVTLQQFNVPTDAMIRIQQPSGGEGAAQAVIEEVRAALGDNFDYRRVELVGPTVGAELLRDGLIATALAMLGITLYVAFRFEWQFGVAAMTSLIHDIITTIGLFSILQIEFNLTSIAALLTLAGYSVNDTVVVFDRVREVMRKKKAASLAEIINESVNATLSRTVMTGGTTLLAVLALLLFGGSTLYGFSLSLFWGIVIGTFSSVFVAAAQLLYMPPVGGRAALPTAAAAPGQTPATRDAG